MLQTINKVLSENVDVTDSYSFICPCYTGAQSRNKRQVIP